MQRTLALLAFIAMTCSVPAAAQMKDGDRQRLIAHLEMTESWLVSELQGLSDAQVKFKMTPVDALAAAHPADPRDQSARRISRRGTNG